MLSVEVGASRFAHCDWLRFDSALHAMLGLKRFPGDDAILRFFGRFTQSYVEAFFRPLRRRLHSSELVWRDIGKGHAVSSFTLELHGWSDTRRFVNRPPATAKFR